MIHSALNKQIYKLFLIATPHYGIRYLNLKSMRINSVNLHVYRCFNASRPVQCLEAILLRHQITCSGSYKLLIAVLPSLAWEMLKKCTKIYVRRVRVRQDVCAETRSSCLRLQNLVSRSKSCSRSLATQFKVLRTRLHTIYRSIIRSSVISIYLLRHRISLWKLA